jgi:hypothetical protein
LIVKVKPMFGGSWLGSTEQDPFNLKVRKGGLPTLERPLEGYCTRSANSQVRKGGLPPLERLLKVLHTIR